MSKVLQLVVVLAVVISGCGGGETILEEAVSDCAILEESGSLNGIRVADEGESLLIDGEGDESSGASIGDIACVLSALEVPESVIARIDGTSALMGQQEAEWGDLIARWSYHPSNGLDIIIEMTDN